MLIPTRIFRAIAPFVFAVLSCFSAKAQAADVTFTIGTATTPLQSLLGVNAGPLHWNGHVANKDLFAEYALIGVKAVRGHDFPGALDMSVMYPDRTKDTTLQSSYNFTCPAGSSGDYGSDYAVSSLQSNGLQLYLRIWDGAGNVKAPSSSERANWVKAAVEVIRHYQEGKWSGYTGLVNSVEIGNEPDSSGFWPSSYTKEEFYQLYVDTAKAIRAAFPTMKIGGPGITQGGFANTTGQTWVRSFFDYVKANGAPLDFFSWHLYSNSPDQFATAASFYRSELDSRGYTATELHTTEWNTQIDLTVNPPSSSVQATNLEYRTKAKGAAIMTATWMTLHQSGIKQSYFYRGNNNDANDYQNYGLFAVDGMPRKTALAFGLWSEFTTYQNRIDPTASTSISGLKAMAAQRSDGQIAILVANTGTSSRSWTTAFTDTRSLSNYNLTLRTVDDNSATTTTSVPAGTVFTIAANTVQLLLLSSTHPSNYSDSWWNANESGWGITITDHGNNAFMQWYTYDQTGHNQKYVISGGTFSGDKCQFSGLIQHATGPSWTLPSFDPLLVSRSTVGYGSIDFCPAGLAAGTIVFNYSNVDGVTGSKQLTRLPFGNDVPHWGGTANTGAADFTDLWWNSSESGWGVSVTQHGNNLFFRIFVYDTDGRPLLFVASGAPSGNATSFTGAVALTTGPWFGSNPFDPNQVVRTATPGNTATLTFSDANNGVLSYTVNGVTKTKTITRMAF